MHGSGYVFDNRPDPLGASSYLEPGAHRDVAVELESDRAREILAGGAQGRVAVVAYQDDGDRVLGRGNDSVYRSDGETIDDTAVIDAPAPTEAQTEATSSTPTPGPTTTTTPSNTGDEGLSLFGWVGIGFGVLFALVGLVGLVGALMWGRP